MVNAHHKRVSCDCELLSKWYNRNVPHSYWWFYSYWIATACWIATYFFVNMLDEWLLIVGGNSTMSSYADFGLFAGKTGCTNSYKTPLSDLFWRRFSQGSVYNPIGGAIYYYNVFVPGLHTMSSVLNISFSSTGTCKSTDKELKPQTYSHAICVQLLKKYIQTLY